MIVQYKQINFTRATLLNAHNTLHLEKSDGGDDVEEGDERVDHQLSSLAIVISDAALNRALKTLWKKLMSKTYL